MVRLERYNVDDLLLIKPAWPVIYPGFRNAMRTENGMAFSAWEGNTCLGAAGVVKWGDVGEAWAYVSTDLVGRHRLSMQRWMRRYMTWFAKVLQVTELTARIHVFAPKAHHTWPQSLGLKDVGPDGTGYRQYRMAL